jgi:hypothetical protein
MTRHLTADETSNFEVDFVRRSKKYTFCPESTGIKCKNQCDILGIGIKAQNSMDRKPFMKIPHLSFLKRHSQTEEH